MKIPNYKFIFSKFKNLYIKKEGGKNRVSLKSIGISATIVCVLLMATILFTPSEDTSYLRKSYQSISIESTQKKEEILPIKKISASTTATIYALNNSDYDNSNEGTLKKSKKCKERTRKQRNEELNFNAESPPPPLPEEKMKYSAPMVISRDEKEDPFEEKIPLGTSIIGKLLTPIDTRVSNPMVRIELPFGGRNKGSIIIPKGTKLFAQVQYPDDGDRVFLIINKGITNDDVEFDIQAQALSGDDFNPGIKGDFHSNLGTRLASNFGWSMSGAAAEVLQEKQVIGTTEGAVILPKSTVENALLEGSKRTITNESGRAIDEINRQKPYVIIPAGKEIIINLTQTFLASKIQQGGFY
ncbi:MAG: TrbI/VirB10 family protein [Oligoflexia bacterium]|nr:TrbI/VirB10 family protein [Oligoflexia bacterium]